MTKTDWISEEISDLREAGLFTQIRTIESPQGAWLVVDGQKVLNFCSNNYLGLANHPHLVEAAKAALERYGVGARGRAHDRRHDGPSPRTGVAFGIVQRR